MESQELKKFAQEILAKWDVLHHQRFFPATTKAQAKREEEMRTLLENVLDNALWDRYKKSPQYTIDQAKWEEGAAERAERQEKLNKAVTDAINKKLGTTKLPSKIQVI